MPALIGPDDAMNTLREVVKGKEDYVYNPDGEKLCRYFEDGKPSCIVGHVLTRLLSDPLSFEIEGMGAHTLTHIFTLDAAHMLRSAQETQDDGGTWGHALEDAESYYKFFTKSKEFANA